MWRLTTFSFFIVWSQLAHSAEWKVDANIAQALSYNDNVRMQNEAQGSMLYRITPVFNAFRATENSKLLAHVSYGTQIYTDIPELDRDTQNYGVEGSYNTELFDYSLIFNYHVAPARNTAESDTGDFATNADKTTWSLSPTISYRLSEVDSLSLSGNYSESKYSSGNFADTENFSVNLAWQRQWTERYSGSVSISYSKFDSINIAIAQSTTSESFSLNISNQYLLTETWNIFATVGGRYTETQQTLNFGVFNSTINTGSEGFLFDIGTRYQGEALTSSLSLGRSLLPSGFGRLNEQTRFSLEMGYKITERLSSGFSASYQTMDSVGGGTQNSRDNITLSPFISWKLTPELSLVGSYRYRFQDSSSRGFSTDSNTVMLTLNYRWPGLSL